MLYIVPQCSFYFARRVSFSGHGCRFRCLIIQNEIIEMQDKAHPHEASNNIRRR